jgi:ribonuclease BN (tRNA processing enzyme)
MMHDVSVQFLGSGDAFGSGGRLQTCIYVEAGDTHCLLDCGTSSLIAMRRWGVEPALIDAILVTHLHGDHFGGVPFFIVEAQLISKRTKPLVVAGPPGVATRLREAMEVMLPGSSRVQQRFDVRVLELPERLPTQIGSVQVTPYPVVHPSGAPPYALRVACRGKVVTYSGDTEWTDTLLEAAANADLFICEAYFFAKKIKYHLDYETLMEHRAALSCRRLIITHMSADMLARLSEIETEYAEDGKRLLL